MKTLNLPSAPKLDATGLHARDCECSRCQLGYKPSDKERQAAHAAMLEQQRKAALRIAAEATAAAKTAEAIRAKEKELERKDRIKREQERLDAEAAAAARKAAPPPRGGFRAWFAAQGGGRGRR